MLNRLSRLARRFLPPPFPAEVTKLRGARIAHSPGHTLMWMVRNGKEVEAKEWSVLQRWGRAPFYALDIGANVGLHALPLAARNPGGKIFAFEAHPVSFSYLQMGALLNGFSDRIELVNSAVCDRSGVVKFNGFSAYGSTADGMRDTGRGWSEKHVLTVPAITLDDWMRERQPAKIDFIKIDIEGGELLALSGAVDLLRTFRPEILMECFPLNLEAYGKTVSDVFEFAASVGYSVCDLDSDPLSPGEFERLPASEVDLNNVILTPRT